MNDIKSLSLYKIYPVLLYIAILIAACVNSGHSPSYPKIITGREWGSVPPTDSLNEHQILRLTIHHGGVYFDPDKNVPEYLKELQDWSRKEKHWMDIPYHYLMDMNGLVYEGRSVSYPGDTNTDYDPRGHLLICIIGNYEDQFFRKVQYESLITWIGYFCRQYNIPVDSIRAHRDYTQTLCPGKNIYKYIESGQLLTDVRKVMNKN